jgi:hypothetical protein
LKKKKVTALPCCRFLREILARISSHKVFRKKNKKNSKMGMLKFGVKKLTRCFFGSRVTQVEHVKIGNRNIRRALT